MTTLVEHIEKQMIEVKLIELRTLNDKVKAAEVELTRLKQRRARLFEQVQRQRIRDECRLLPSAEMTLRLGSGQGEVEEEGPALSEDEVGVERERFDGCD